MAPEMLVVGGDANGAYSEMPAGRIGATCGRQAGRDGRLRWPHPGAYEVNEPKAPFSSALSGPLQPWERRVA